MFRFAVSLAVIVAVFSTSADAERSVASARTRSSSCVPTWRLVSTNSPKQSWFSSIDVLSTNDVWAAGAQANGERPFIAHWNGKVWRTVAPAPRSNGRLLAVAAVGPKDVWTFGYKTIKKSDPVVGGGLYRPIAQHWNGRAWRSIAMAAQNWRLLSAAAVSPRSIWVGESERILHWDGTRWDVAGAVGGNAISARSDHDVWVAGGSPTHWDGKRWAETSFPESSDTPVYGPSVYDIAAARSSVWAVGDQWFHVDQNRTEGEIYRWTGTQWSWDFHRNNMSVTAVTAITDDNAWAVADSPADQNDYVYGPSLPLHWDGSHWQALPRPQAFAAANFTDLAAVSATDIWAVGMSTLGKAVIAHYACGH